MGLNFEEIDPKGWKCIEVKIGEYESIRDAFVTSAEVIIEEMCEKDFFETGMQKSESLDRASFESGFKEGFAFAMFSFATGKIKAGTKGDYENYKELNDG